MKKKKKQFIVVYDVETGKSMTLAPGQTLPPKPLVTIPIWTWFGD